MNVLASYKLQTNEYPNKVSKNWEANDSANLWTQ